MPVLSVCVYDPSAATGRQVYGHLPLSGPSQSTSQSSVPNLSPPGRMLFTKYKCDWFSCFRDSQEF